MLPIPAPGHPSLLRSDQKPNPTGEAPIALGYTLRKRTGADAGTDTDAGTDAGTDTGADAGADADADAGTDAGADTEPQRSEKRAMLVGV